MVVYINMLIILCTFFQFSNVCLTFNQKFPSDIKPYLWHFGTEYTHLFSSIILSPVVSNVVSFKRRRVIFHI